MKKNILLILFAILAFALALIITSPFFKNFRNRFINAEKILAIQKNISKNNGNDKTNEKSEFTIIGVGDIMLGSKYSRCASKCRYYRGKPGRNFI